MYAAVMSRVTAGGGSNSNMANFCRTSCEGSDKLFQTCHVNGSCHSNSTSLPGNLPYFFFGFDFFAFFFFAAIAFLNGVDL